MNMHSEIREIDITGCPGCQSMRLLKRGKIPDSIRFARQILTEPLPGGELLECSDCMLQFRWPRLPDEVTKRLYSGGDSDAWSEHPAARVDWAIAREVVTGAMSHGSVIDLGCFTGGFLKVLPAGFELYGVEISKKAAAVASSRGITVVGVDLDVPDIHTAKFDVCTAFDVIEHVRNPSAMLRQMARSVRPAGLVLVGTSDTTTLPWRMLGSHNHYCINPEHVSFINPKWCAISAASSGLELKRIIRYRHGIFPPKRRAIDLLKATAFWSMPTVFGNLRRKGVGTLAHPVELEYPATWESANDHMLAIFERTGAP